MRSTPAVFVSGVSSPEVELGGSVIRRPRPCAQPFRERQSWTSTLATWSAVGCLAGTARRSRALGSSRRRKCGRSQVRWFALNATGDEVSTVQRPLTLHAPPEVPEHLPAHAYPPDRSISTELAFAWQDESLQVTDIASASTCCALDARSEPHSARAEDPVHRLWCGGVRPSQTPARRVGGVRCRGVRAHPMRSRWSTSRTGRRATGARLRRVVFESPPPPSFDPSRQSGKVQVSLYQERIGGAKRRVSASNAASSKEELCSARSCEEEEEEEGGKRC
uniref:Uncharacterized protein n=1 Tax=Noctiluca scintillans TaxID=2966 RepID=A0A7S1F393_NOCSC